MMSDDDKVKQTLQFNKKGQIHEIIKMKSDPFHRSEIPKIKSKNRENQKLKIIAITNPESQMEKKEEQKGKQQQKIVRKHFYSIEYKGSANRVPSEQILRTARPCPLDEALNYYQINVNLIESHETSFWIGLSTVSNNDSFPSKFCLPGYSSNSIGINVSADSNQILVFQNGSKLFDSQEDEVFENLKEIQDGDCLGCGFSPHKHSVFFTLNGKKITPNIKLIEVLTKQNDTKSPVLLYYPTVGFKSKNSLQFHLIFENSSEQFRFDYNNNYKQASEKLLKKQILHQSHPCALNQSVYRHTGNFQQQKYNLVRNYLRFYGFSNTTKKIQEEMEKRCMKFQCTARPVKNHEKYQKRYEQVRRDFQSKNKEKKIKKKDKKKSKNVELKNVKNFDVQIREDDAQEYISIHSSEKSDSNEYDYQEFIQRKYLSEDMKKSRKKIEENQLEEIKAQKKKEEYIRNEKEKIDKFNQCIANMKKNETLLFNNQRVDIMKNIRIANIEGGRKKLIQFFPQIMKSSQYLEVYFKAMSFIKVCLEYGTEKGLEFMREEENLFAEFQNCLFPFYKDMPHNNIVSEFKPLREILYFFCHDFKKDFCFQKQLLVFSNTIGRIICEKLGFVGASDLEIVYGHFHAVVGRIEELGISMGGIQLKGYQK